MKRTSLADAKTHLSALVDEAEHHKKRIIILRHGKPAAAIVPVEVAVGGTSVPARPRLSKSDIRALLDRLGAVAPDVSAVAELLAGRR